jgi:hypothetical protein
MLVTLQYLLFDITGNKKRRPFPDFFLALYVPQYTLLYLKEALVNPKMENHAGF